MPLYEYECTSCHRRTEKIQKFSDPELTVCPHCGGPLERTITAAAIAFKGGGWFKDGYGSVKPAAAAGGGEGSGSAGGGGSAPDNSSATLSSGDSAKSGDGAKSGDSAKPAAAAASAAPAAAPAAAAKA
jgi:putative FmdB family regulatory protein